MALHPSVAWQRYTQHFAPILSARYESQRHKSPANVHWEMTEGQIARRIGNRWRYERVDILSLGISRCGETSPTWGWGTKPWIYWVTLWYTSHRQIHMAHTVLGLLSCNHLTSQAVWWPSEKHFKRFDLFLDSADIRSNGSSRRVQNGRSYHFTINLLYINPSLSEFKLIRKS